jgi:hypothetical protein
MNKPILSREDLIDKFPNGRERYNKQAIFKSVIRMLEYPDSELAVVESLLQIIEQQSKLIAQMTLLDHYPGNRFDR